MLADIFDAIQILTHVYVSAHSKKKQKAPDPYPRPGEKKGSEERKKKLPNPLLLALRGVDPEEAKKTAGPIVVPLPPRKKEA